AGRSIHDRPHLPQRGHHLLAVDHWPGPGRLAGPTRRWTRPQHLAQRLAGMITVPARRRAQLVQDHRLPGLTRAPIPDRDRLGDCLSLTHRQSHASHSGPHPATPARDTPPDAGIHLMRQRSTYAGISDESTRVLETD